MTTIINTTEELEALPKYTIIQDDEGLEWLVKPTRRFKHHTDDRIFFLSIERGGNYRSDRVPLPATIIQIGHETTPEEPLQQ